MKIIHAFVGSCVESELLSEYGEVYAFGIEKTKYSKRNVDQFIKCDLTKAFPSDIKFDFGLFHPMCKKYSTATPNPDKYSNQIPFAERIAKEHCEYWVIENVRNSPIGFNSDNLRLNGGIFDKGLKYERVFKSNFEIEQPEMKDQHTYDMNLQEVRKGDAEKIKGWEGNYHVHDIIMNCLPKYYVEYIISQCPAFSVGKRPIYTF